MDLLRLNRAVLSLQILNRDLSLAVRPQPPQQATLAHVGQLLAQASGHGVRQWHAILSLIAGVPKHNSLVASTDVKIILANMNTSSNVRALLIDAHQDFASLVTQAF